MCNNKGIILIRQLWSYRWRRDWQLYVLLVPLIVASFLLYIIFYSQGNEEWEWSPRIEYTKDHIVLLVYFRAQVGIIVPAKDFELLAFHGRTRFIGFGRRQLTLSWGDSFPLKVFYEGLVPANPGIYLWDEATQSLLLIGPSQEHFDKDVEHLVPPGRSLSQPRMSDFSLSESLERIGVSQEQIGRVLNHL